MVGFELSDLSARFLHLPYYWACERLARQWQERGELMTRGQLLKQFQRARAAILPGYRELEKRESPDGGERRAE